jgi:hypothetical protein
VEARASEIPCSPRAGEAPVASPLARLEAAEGPLVTSLAHRNVELDPAARLLLRELDGRPRAEVVRSLARSLLEHGGITGPGGRSPSEDDARAAVAERLDAALASLARRALLAG